MTSSQREDVQAHSLRPPVGVLPRGVARVHHLPGDDLGMALVPMPIELGDKAAVEAQPQTSHLRYARRENTEARA